MRALDPMRARRAEVLARPSALHEILYEGSRKARTIASETMERVRDAVKLKYRYADANMEQPEFESILEAYPVRLQNFEGPLDLLLHLIKKHEVDIYDIPIALITHQYLEYIDLMQEMNLDVAGEFLVMAATLIHIKSRTLLPRPDPAQEDPEEDPREALIRRLLEHQKFKAAAELLHERETLRSAQWTRPDGPIAEIAGEAPEPEIEVDLFSLISAFRSVVERAKQRPADLPARRADPHREPDRAAAGEALGDRGLRVRGSLRGRAQPRRHDRHVPGDARDDPAEADPRVPDRRGRADSRLQARASRRRAETPRGSRARKTNHMSDHLKPIVEALIFASPEPLTPKTLYRLLDGEPREDVDAALAALRADYDRPGGLQIVEVAGGFQIVTRTELHEWVRKLFHERTTQKLSVQALETLAVIAYKQPITAPEIAEIRGVSSSGGVLSTLVERRLIKTVGRKQVVGRPFMYATTREFLERFGLNDITDLPKVEEMADALGFELPSALAESAAAPRSCPSTGAGTGSRSARARSRRSDKTVH